MIFNILEKIYTRILIWRVYLALWSLDRAIKKYQKGCWDTNQLEGEVNGVVKHKL